MILGTIKKIEDHILGVLAVSNSVTAHDIQQTLLQAGTPCTIQGIYRALRLLQHEGVVVKEGQSFSISVPWLLNLSFFVDKMKDTYMQHGYLLHFLPKKEKQSRTWRYTKLSQLTDFWAQLLVAMASVSESHIALSYSPHVWYEITESEKEARFMKTYMSFLDAEYTIVGNRSLLDRYSVTTRTRLPCEIIYFAQDDERVLSDRRLYITVIDDFVLTIILENLVIGALGMMYRSIKEEKDINIPKLRKAMRGLRGKHKIKIEKNSILARKYKRKFEKIFGPLRKPTNASVITS